MCLQHERQIIFAYSYNTQLEPPQDVDSYVHRVGRTGRMGKSGQSILMLLPSERGYLELLKSVGVMIREAKELVIVSIYVWVLSLYVWVVRIYVCVLMCFAYT